VAKKLTCPEQHLCHRVVRQRV